MKNGKTILCSVIVLFLVAFNSLVHAGAPSYKVDGSYQGQMKSSIVYMAMLPSDQLCVLLGSGEVLILDPGGKEVGKFSTNMKGKGSAIAVDETGKIIVLATESEQQEYKYKGRKRKRNVPIRVNCAIFDQSGKKLRTLELKGAKSAKAAQVVKGKLIVGDDVQRSLLICDMNKGEVEKKVKKGIRICCGIFDFCKGPKDTIMMANLGAFKVQSFSASGTSGKSFGKRGKKINDFQGCCNPVSVASLASGSIVTAEKDPTRVKVYDKHGKEAKSIDGIEELVKGCSHIPMAADNKDNVYLASNRKKQIIKCLPKK